MILSCTARPDLRELVFELRAVEADWFEIGLRLGVPEPQLRSLANNGTTLCMIDMLSFWLKATPDPSWKHVIKAVGNQRLAYHLIQKFTPGK